MFIQRLTTILVFSVLSVALSAQTLLTPEQAISIAIANNYGMSIAKNNVQIAQNNVTRGNAGMLPEVNFRSGFTYGNANTNQRFSTGAGQDRLFASSVNATAGVEATWTIYDGGNMGIEYSRLKNLQTLSEQELRIQELNLKTNVLQAYFAIVRLNTQLNTLNKNLSLYTERVRLADAALSLGSGNKPESLQAQVDLNAQKAAIIRQENAIANAKYTLNFLLNRKSEEDFSVINDFALQSFAPAKSASTTLPDLQAQDSRLIIANQTLDQLQVIRRPHIGLNAAYNYLRNQNQAGFLTYNQNYGLTAGINLTYNLYNGKNSRRQIENARINVLNAEAVLNNTISQIDNAYAQALRNYTSANQLVQLENENLKLAEENLAIIMAAFRLGKGNTLIVKDAQRSYEDAQNRQLQALYETKLAEIELARYQ